MSFECKVRPIAPLLDDPASVGKENLHEALAGHLLARSETGRVHDCGGEVDKVDEVVHHPARFDLPRPPDDQRDTCPHVVKATLAPRPGLPVIGCDDQDRVFGQAGLLELRQHLANFRIESLDLLVKAPEVFAHSSRVWQVRRHLNRIQGTAIRLVVELTMTQGRSPPEAEWSVATCCIGENLREMANLSRRRNRPSARLREAWPPALSAVRNRVTGFPQHRRIGVEGVVQGTAEHGRVAQPPDVLTRQQSRPGRMAHRRGVVCVGEPDPFRRRPVDVRRLRKRVAVDTPVLPRHVIRDHEKDIRSFACGLSVDCIRRKRGGWERPRSETPKHPKTQAFPPSSHGQILQLPSSI